MNNHLNKLRDKFVKNDTQSSCTSSQVVFPKPTKRRQTSTDYPELRRSPRKRAPRSMFDENIPGSQHSGSQSRYSETCLKWPLSKRPKLGFQDLSSLNAGHKYCRMLQGEHSAILSIFIKLPFVIKIFVLTILEWLFYTGFNVC